MVACRSVLESIRCGAALGLLAGAVWALVDATVTSLACAFVPYSWPVIVVCAYLIVGGLAGIAAGLLAAVRAPSDAAAVRARVRCIVLIGIAGAAVLLLLERGLQAEYAALIAGASLAAAALAGRRVIGYLADTHGFAGAVLAAAVLTTCWYPFEDRGGPAQMTAFTWVLRQGALLAAALGAFLAARGQTRRRPRLLAVDGPRASVVQATVLAAAGLAVGLTCVAARTTRPLHQEYAGGPAARGEPGPNVALIVLDTVRADHLSLYGYPRRTSPELERFAAGARTYERVASTSPWTVPSHASMFTGLLPHQHGAHNVDAARAGLRGTSWAECRRAGIVFATPLPVEQTTLAELLVAEGYTTAAFVANSGGLHRNWGLAQGFQLYDDTDTHSLTTLIRAAYTPATRLLRECQQAFLGRRPPQRTAAELNADVLAWLMGGPREPFFLFVNYIDPHTPYDTHAEFDWGGTPVPEMTQQCVPPEHRAACDAYDSELAYLDHHLGRVLDALTAGPRGERTLVIVCSDHGEAFGEHGWLEHGKSLHHEELNVPLVVRPPGGQVAEREPRPTTLARVFGDVLRAVGLDSAVAPDAPVLPAGLSDAALPSDWRPAACAELRPRWNRDGTVHAGGGLHALYTVDGRKAILNPDGVLEVYDLVADPGETRCVAADQPELVEYVAPWLRQWARTAGGSGAHERRAAAADRELLDRLRSLGYVQ